MNDSESDKFDPQVKAWLESAKPPTDQIMEKQRIATVQRARASIGQRDTVMFAFIKLWTVLADMLAPIFANFAAKRAIAMKPKTTQYLHKK